MAISVVSNVRIAGLASAVPEHVRSLAHDIEAFGEQDALKISQSTGVNSRYVVPEGMCTSDLCLAAAEKLLAELNWSRESIDLLVFVSQTPDYLLPATSCSLQGRLGLSKSCAAFDINLGCSGYIYGLWVVSNLVASGAIRRALLLVGDTISRIASPQDRSVAPLFGDAGTATAIEFDAGSSTADSRMTFSLGTDGTGENHLIVPAGGFRLPRSSATAERVHGDGNNLRSSEDLYMNGAEIFTFTLREVQPLVQGIMEVAEWDVDSIDAIVMHQANSFMLKHLTKRMRLPSNKTVLALEKYGNTSSASIPLAMTDALRTRLQNQQSRLLLAGFGVGFSWGAVTLSCGNMIAPPLITVPGVALSQLEEDVVQNPVNGDSGSHDI
jgi:3-oxoacyl-[acyl-carrier-protein] synthase-3